MLFPVLIDTESLEVDVPARSELRLYRTRHVDGTLHVQVLDAVFHDAALDRDDACHLNGATERDLAVSLREVQVSDTELCALDMHGEIDLGAAGEILDVAVSAVFGTAGDGASALTADFLFQRRVGMSGVYVLRLWWFRDVAVHV